MCFYQEIKKSLVNNNKQNIDGHRRYSDWVKELLLLALKFANDEGDSDCSLKSRI